MASQTEALQRFCQDLQAESAKLSGHSHTLVQSILDSLQLVLANEYTQHYVLPAGIEAAAVKPTEVKPVAPVVLSRPQISIASHSSSIGDPTYRPTLTRHQTLTPGSTSPRRNISSTILKPSTPTQENGVEPTSFGPSPVFKAQTLKESSSASTLPSSATLKPVPGNVKVALKNVSTKFMSRLAMFEPNLAKDGSAPSAATKPAQDRTSNPGTDSPVSARDTTSYSATDSPSEDSELRSTKSDPNSHKHQIELKAPKLEPSQQQEEEPKAEQSTDAQHSESSSPVKPTEKDSVPDVSEQTAEPVSVDRPPKEAPPRPPRPATLKAAPVSPPPEPEVQPEDFSSPRTAKSKRSRKDAKESPPPKSSTPPIPEAPPTPAQQRYFVANEIVESERNYLRDLQIIIELYLVPLKQNGIVSAADLRTIFSQVEVIAKISETLLKKLQASMDAHQSQGVEIKFGKPILELCEFMKSYSMYVNNYEQAMQVVQQYKRGAKKFVKFLAETMKNERVRNHTIEDYLIVPIQRIPRYVLLLSEFVKHTPENHEDYADLTKALGKVKDIADYVNAAKRRIELLQRGVDIMNTVGIKEVPAHRKFIDEDVFYETNVAGLAEKELPRNNYALYLFSDIIVLAKYKGHDLAKVKIQDIIKSSLSEDPSDPTALAMVLDSNYQLFAANADVLNRVVKTWQETRTTFEKEMLALEARRKASSVEEAAEAGTSAVSASEKVKSPEGRQRKSKKSDKRGESNDS